MKQDGWRFASATVAGVSHEKSGDPCQDEHLVDYPAGEAAGILAAIVSDGAGSVSHSDVGSRITCRRLMNCLRGHFTAGRGIVDISRDVVAGWLEETAAALEEAAGFEGVEVRQLSCTVVAAVASADHAVCFQVGDGAIVIRTEAEPWRHVFWPQHGEYINTTHFITDTASRAAFEFSSSAVVIADMAVFSDGIEALVLRYATREVHGPFFDTVFPPVRALEATGGNDALSANLAKYLASPAICDRTDDDKTLVLATRATAASTTSTVAPPQETASVLPAG